VTAAALGPFDAPEATLAAELGRLPRSDLLLGYQQRAIAKIKASSLLVIEKSRRIGLTWGIASYAGLLASASRAAGGMKVWYMGYDQEMAREFVDVVGMWAGAFQIAASAVEETVIHDPEGDVKAFRVSMASGFEVVALPSVARALRGKQGLVIIDEAAFHSDLEEVLKAAIALLMWGGRVVVVSTHDGIDNPFNQLLDRIKAGEQKGDYVRITFDDALADGLYERVRLTGKHRGLDRDAWIADVRDTYGDNAGEELDCIPKSGAGSWIASADLAACEHPDAGRPQLYQGGLVYVGRDVARRRDFSVIWAFELVRGVLWLRDRWESNNASFREQDDVFDAQFARFRVAAARIDQTGMGEKVVEDAQARHGTTRVQGVLFTAPSRLHLATLLRDRFEAETIRIPPDPIIRQDFRTLKRAGPQGRALVEGDGMHPDRFWAAALACEAADMPSTTYGGWESARAPRPFDEATRDDDDVRMFKGGAW
jgi:phage FluMu gp28-like protein